MKILLLSFTTIFLLFQSPWAYGQEFIVPYKVDSVFNSSFSNAIHSEWQTDGDNVAVTFKVSNGQSIHIIYDTLGHMREKYMAIPLPHVPTTITSFIKDQYPAISIKNYWVKQKGIERIYKVQLSEEIVGTGSIIGSAYGNTASTDSSLTTSDNIEDQDFNSLLEDSSSLYFDRFGNPISSLDALSGVYIAKQKIAEKPAKKIIYQTKNSKKSKSSQNNKKK